MLIILQLDFMFNNAFETAAQLRECEVTFEKQKNPAAEYIPEVAWLSWLSSASCEDPPCHMTGPHNALYMD